MTPSPPTHPAERRLLDRARGDDDLGALVDRSVTTGVAPGPPDAPLGDATVQQQLGGVARALRAAGAVRAQAVREGGRPAWRISVRAEQDVHALPGETGDRLELTIDRGTDLPLRVRETYRGDLVAERRLGRLRLDRSLAARLFAPSQQPREGSISMSRLESDDGFRHRPLDAVRAVVGYAPLAPGWLPQGFRRAETATGVAPTVVTGPEGMNPPTRDAVSTAYRRGLDTVIVTTRRVDGQRWQDPVAVPEGFLVRPQRVCFRAGALRGACGELIVDPRATPHVWAIAGGLVVTVAGDLTQGDLERAAGSLRPAG